MADSKISALPASTTPLAGTETLPIVQSGATKKVSVADLTTGRAVSLKSVSSVTGTVASVPNATATTLYTFSEVGLYQVFAYFTGWDAVPWSAQGVVSVTSTFTNLKLTAVNTAQFALSLSGLNLQVTQGTGGAIDTNFTILKIA